MTLPEPLQTFVEPLTALQRLLDLIEKGRLGSNEPIIFLHTGGLPSLFAFEF